MHPSKSKRCEELLGSDTMTLPAHEGLWHLLPSDSGCRDEFMALPWRSQTHSSQQMRLAAHISAEFSSSASELKQEPPGLEQWQSPLWPLLRGKGQKPQRAEEDTEQRKIHLQPCGARVEWGLKDTWNIIFCETWKPAEVCACRGDNSDKQDCHLSSGCFSRLALKCVSCLTPEVMEPMPLLAATKEDCGPKAGEMRTCMDTHTAAFQTLSSSHAATDSLQSFSVFFFVLT